MVTLVETPHPISPYIANARIATTDVLGGARGYVEEGVSKWIGFEKRVERESSANWPLTERSSKGRQADDQER